MAEERRLAAILAADVVGYSRLMQHDEPGTLAMLRKQRKEVFEPLVAQHQGRIFKVTGDGMLVEFGSAVNAVQCAVALQQATAAANQDLPEDNRIVLRIGVNLSDVVVDGDDLYGDGINIAARLEGVAEPGGIVVSATVFDYVRNKVAARFESLGAQSLKNIAEPVLAYRIAGTPVVAAAGSRPVADKPVIAVLPFANMSRDPEQAYFSDGIAEDIITELQRFRNLRVLARNSSFRYRDEAVDIRRIGRELGARYVVEGSVRRAGDAVRVTAQLIDAETAAHLWAERYDRGISDLFAIQDEISRRIVATVWSAVDAAEKERVVHKGPRQMAAYDYVLKARKSWFNFTKESNLEAGALIAKALELDPRYATAWAWLAWVHINDWRYDWVEDAEQSSVSAMEAARQAIALDPHDYFTRWPTAHLLIRARRYDEGLAEYEKVLALNPHDSRFLDEMSWALCAVGRPREAIALLERAIALDPMNPDSFFGSLGFAYYQLRDYDKALAAMAKLAHAPGGMNLEIRAAAYAQLGREEDARAAMMEVLKQRQGRTIRTAARFPFKSQADLDHWLEGLRKAGLPE